MSINPKVKDFLEKNKDITVIGLWWSLYWRGVAVVFGVYLAVMLVVAILTIAFE